MSNTDKKLIITYTKMGGFVGYNNRLNIYSDSTYELKQFNNPVKTGSMNNNLFDQLTDIVNSIESYEDKYEGPLRTDIIHYNVTANSKTVLIDSQAPEIPSELKKIIELLQRVKMI